MCGIVGGLSERNIVPIILEGLSRLEYRGYDSAGVAVINNANEFLRERVTDRVAQLTQMCNKFEFRGFCGIGHTRWATHGGVNVDNAHPHISTNSIALVHNGIIENYASLREELKALGYKFESETDTEVIVHLIHSFYIKNNNLLVSVRQAVSNLEGAYAIGVMCLDNPNEIVCARLGSPLVLGLGIGEMFFASDISALLPVTQKVVYMEDGDIAVINRDNYKVYDKNENTVLRKTNVSELSVTQTELGEYRHYMQKEIFEQPDAIAKTLQSLGNNFSAAIFGTQAAEVFDRITQVQILACGTSYNAGMVAKYWIEEFANLECHVDIASEYRYARPPSRPDTLIISISQSGETADTIASVKHAYDLGMRNSLAICNVAESSLVRLSRLSILTKAGPEIGVASTKAFTTQLVVLFYLANALAKAKGCLTNSDEEEHIRQIRRLPQLIIDTFALENKLKLIAKEMEYKQHALFLGRNTLYPIAREGSLKLKEISYIHAEAYAAGELKHGPLALIDKEMPTIVLMPGNLLHDKVKSNVQEVLARQGVVYLFTDKPDDMHDKCHRVIEMPGNIPKYLLPVIYTIPLQLLSYHTAVTKGTDVDKPRNLAKSVTVE
ncbi:MAG: glmS [Burkholderiales bacterium]|jgi:glucosamine--fructose-6-phosphate aminotransferase (isomerizing)|nr:glmS [Burkholderiales bacterium]